MQPDPQPEDAEAVPPSRRSDDPITCEAEAAWEAEIHDRIRAIEEGREIGVSYEGVMRSAEEHLAR